MKIAVVGSGAVGSYYGALLHRAGHEVHLLLRSDYQTVRAQGVTIRSPRGDFTTTPTAAQSPHEIGTSDLVLVALKTTANDQFANLLPPLIGRTTAVLTLQNGLGNEEALAKLFGPEQILGGLCFVYLNRVAPGVIQHLGEGKILLGEFRRSVSSRVQNLAAQFQEAGIPCQVTPNLAHAHWEKLVWNIPFNGLGVASVAGLTAQQDGCVKLSGPIQPCLTTGQLLDCGEWERLIRALMLETIAAANALGHDLSAELAEKMIVMTRATASYKSSTVLDFEAGRPLELDSLFLEPLRQAQCAGLAMPRLATLATILSQLEAVRPTVRRG